MVGGVIDRGSPSGAARISSAPDAAEYRKDRREHWNAVAAGPHRAGRSSRSYRCRIAEIYQFLIPRGSRVLELGSGQGDLLAAVDPALGVGVDFSEAMVAEASRRHAGLSFLVADAHELPIQGGEFDFVIASDLLNDAWDVQRLLAELEAVTAPCSRLIVNTYSRLWQLPLGAARAAGLAQPLLEQNWLTVEDVSSLLRLVGWEVVKAWPEVLWPVATPVLNPLFNRFVAKLWPFRMFTLANFVMARPLPASRRAPASVSVVVPARNEAGNIDEIFARTPAMGRSTELVFVEGHSTDGTFDAITRAAAAHPERPCQVFRQTGSGKGDAVRLGMSKARGDLVMILDADLTVPPEDLPRFYDALWSGQAEFVNGVRLVYPIERQAMRFFNLLGNKFFSLAFSWLLGQPVKDTLCGTKALSKENYERIAANRAYFGDFDPFGDFDLLFGAAKLGLRIVDLPVRYRARKYGTTNISRWTHGALLLKMTAVAARRIKFS